MLKLCVHADSVSVPSEKNRPGKPGERERENSELRERERGRQTDRQTDRQTETERNRQTETDRHRQTQTEKSENSNSNAKTLILKDSSVRSIWTYLTASPCYTTNTNKHDYTTNRYYKYE